MTQLVVETLVITVVLVITQWSYCGHDLARDLPLSGTHGIKSGLGNMVQSKTNHRYITFTRELPGERHFPDSSFYPRDAMLARIIAIATCLSVCPSVTRRYCAKMKKAIVMICSPSGSPWF